MNLLKQLLTVVAFGYMCYHIYTFGPGMFNVTVLVILILSTVANYFREKRESELKANENARKARWFRFYVKETFTKLHTVNTIRLMRMIAKE